MREGILAKVVVNDIYQEQATNKRFRILWVTEDLQVAFVYELGKKNGFPFLISLYELGERIESGEVSFESERRTNLSCREWSEAQVKKRDEIWNTIGNALENEPDIYDKKKRSQMLDDISERTGINKNNLYRSLRRYWQEGKTKDCFLPNYVTTNTRNPGGESKRGPKAVKSQRGYLLTEDDYKKFRKAIDAYYLKKNGNTLEMTYTLMLGDYYSAQIKDENGNIVSSELFPEDQLPSFWQFRYWYRKNIRVDEALKAKLGEGEYELNHESELNRADYGVMAPGSEFQIDATIADLYIVSPYNRDDIVGRPVIYLVVDVFSRIITGLYVGLEGPSWTGMMMALYNTFTEKVSYCKEYGQEITEEEWPCHHIPDVLLGDRGELFSDNAIGIIENFGIRVDNTPPYMGLCKPFVERMFKTLDGTTTVFIPGRVKASTHKRGGEDYRLDAILTIKEFTSIMIKAVLQYNNNKILDTMEIPEAIMRSDADIQMRARDIWNWGIANCGGMLGEAEEKDIRLALLPKNAASITRKGVYFQKRYYSCPKFEELGLFVEAKEKGVKMVDIAYDLRNVSRIYVWLDKDEEPYLCEMMEWEAKYSDLSSEEFEFISMKWSAKKESGKREEQQGINELEAFINKTVENAQKDSEKTARTKSEKLENMKENRRKAKEEERQEQAFTGEKYEDPVWEEQDPVDGNDHASDEELKDNPEKALDSDDSSGDREMSPTMRRIFESIKKRRQEKGESNDGKGKHES